MKAVIRFLLKQWKKLGILFVACAIGVTGFVGPWPIDQTPQLSTREGQRSIEIAATLGKRVSQLHPSTGLIAGWHGITLAVAEGTPLAGYGDRRGAASTGFRDPLTARGFYLSTGNASVAILCVDLLIIPPEVAALVNAKVRERVPNELPILFTATHTHGGPGAWNDSFLGEIIAGDYNPDVIEALAVSCAEAILGAIEKQEPAMWAWIETEEPAHVSNRTVKGGATDPSLEALVLRKSGKQNDTAVIGIYGAHATCLSHSEMEFHGDYPGMFIRHLESTSEFNFAAFASGAVGSQSPAGEGDGWEKAELIGRNLAVRISSEMANVKWSKQMQLSAATAEFPVAGLQVRLGESTRLAPFMAKQIHPGVSSICALRMDDHVWLGVPYELSCLISVPLRERAKSRGKRLHLTCFAGDYLGYVIPDHLYPDPNIYEARLNFLGPYGGSFTEAMLRAIIDQQ